MIKTSAQLVQEAKVNIEEVSIEQLDAQLSVNTVLIDVREPAEYGAGHIEQAVNFPRGVLEMQLANHPSFSNLKSPLEAMNEHVLYLICRSGARSALAAESLQKMGFKNVVSVAGGMVAWEQAGHPIEK